MWTNPASPDPPVDNLADYPCDMTPEEEEVRRRIDAHELYVDYGPGLDALTAERTNAKVLADRYNSSPATDQAARDALVNEIFGAVGEGVFIEPPLHVAYGSQTTLGDHVYANFGLTLIDDGPVRVGDNVMFGPHVTITATGHPVHPDLRREGPQFSASVTIEDDVWIGGQVTILPGVTIGRGSVIAAGAVVTASVPSMVVAGGVPARVLRRITDADRDWRWQEPRTLN